MDGHIRAPAAFHIAAQQPQTFTGEGVKPVPQHGYIPNPQVGILSSGRPSADIPTIRDQLLGGDLRDVDTARQKVESYGSPSEIQRFERELPNYVEIYAQDQFRLSDFLDPAARREETFVASVEKTVDSRPDVKMTVEYEVPASRMESFVEWLETQKDVAGYTFSRNSVEVQPQDAQPYSDPFPDWLRTGTSHQPETPETRQQTEGSNLSDWLNSTPSGDTPASGVWGQEQAVRGGEASGVEAERPPSDWFAGPQDVLHTTPPESSQDVWHAGEAGPEKGSEGSGRAENTGREESRNGWYVRGGEKDGGG
jgi:hypothetical protein